MKIVPEIVCYLLAQVFAQASQKFVCIEGVAESYLLTLL